MAKAVKKTAGKKSAGKRELISPNGDKRYIKRDEKGQIKESDDQGKSLSQDVKKAAKTKVKPGYGDQGATKKEIGLKEKQELMRRVVKGSYCF